jgi:predicted nucleic acid-binding protein
VGRGPQRRLRHRSHSAQIAIGCTGARAALWELEVANTLVMVQRRRILTAEEAEQALAYLEAFGAALADVDGYSLSSRQAFILAQELELTAYDAVYIELAKRDRVPLATVDKKLRDAATKARIVLV